MELGVFGLLLMNEFWSSWLNSWLFCSFFFPICQVMYVSYRQRKLWGELIQPPIPLILKACMMGLGIGMIFSVFTATFFVFSIQLEEVVLVWLTAILLACGGSRFLCFSYSIGLLAMLHLICSQFDLSEFWIVSVPLMQIIQEFSVTDWLWIVALIHLVEWLFVRMDGLNGRQLIISSHHSGKEVNGFLLNRLWPLPCVLPTPIGFLPVPLVVGFASFNLSKPLEQQKRLASTFTLFYTLLMFATLWVAKYYAPGLWVAASITLFGHDVIFRWQRRREKRAEPLYTSGEFGLRVVDVLPTSTAAKLGIQSGDIVQKVNDISVYTTKDIERITEQAAHCKLELLDQQLDHHFVQKVIYEDDPKHLGIIGAISQLEVAATKEKEEKGLE